MRCLICGLYGRSKPARGQGASALVVQAGQGCFGGVPKSRSSLIQSPLKTEVLRWGVCLPLLASWSPGWRVARRFFGGGFAPRFLASWSLLKTTRFGPGWRLLLTTEVLRFWWSRLARVASAVCLNRARLSYGRSWKVLRWGVCPPFSRRLVASENGSFRARLARSIQARQGTGALVGKAGQGCFGGVAKSRSCFVRSPLKTEVLRWAVCPPFSRQLVA